MDTGKSRDQYQEEIVTVKGTVRELRGRTVPRPSKEERLQQIREAWGVVRALAMRGMFVDRFPEIDRIDEALKE